MHTHQEHWPILVCPCQVPNELTQKLSLCSRVFLYRWNNLTKVLFQQMLKFCQFVVVIAGPRALWNNVHNENIASMFRVLFCLLENKVWIINSCKCWLCLWLIDHRNGKSSLFLELRICLLRKVKVYFLLAHVNLQKKMLPLKTPS